MAKELSSAVGAARSLAPEHLGAATEKLYLLLLQVPAANKLLASIRDVPSGDALANSLLASGPALYQDAAFVTKGRLEVCSSHKPPS